jgi:hypothetical protein
VVTAFPSPVFRLTVLPFFCEDFFLPFDLAAAAFLATATLAFFAARAPSSSEATFFSTRRILPTIALTATSRTTTTSVMSYKAKKREKRKETLQIRRHAPLHVSEWTHAKDATED